MSRIVLMMHNSWRWWRWWRWWLWRRWWWVCNLVHLVNFYEIREYTELGDTDCDTSPHPNNTTLLPPLKTDIPLLRCLRVRSLILLPKEWTVSCLSRRCVQARCSETMAAAGDWGLSTMNHTAGRSCAQTWNAVLSTVLQRVRVQASAQGLNHSWPNY